MLDEHINRSGSETQQDTGLSSIWPDVLSGACEAKPVVGSRERLVADADQIAAFYRVIFKHCHGAGGWIAPRALEHSKEGRCVHRSWIPWNDKTSAALAEIATEVANLGKPGAVLAPPVCLFVGEGDSGQRRAGEADVLLAPALVVDLDNDPKSGFATITAILGLPTVVVNSGGQWAAPDGKLHAKLHCYWRLTRPAATQQEKADLKEARKLAARIAGGDETAAPLSHPIRLPGSWHTKAEPRLCRIERDDRNPEFTLCDAREISLEDALSRLRAEAARRGIDAKPGRERGDREGFKTKTPLEAMDLDALVATMLALVAQRGDVCIRSDLNKSFILATDSPTVLGDWKELLTPTDAVLSVAGLTGAITSPALKTALGLSTVASSGDYGDLLNRPTVRTTATAAEYRAATANRWLGASEAWAAAAPVAIAYAASIALDLSTGINFSTTLTGNLILANPTNVKPGQSGYISLKQDATGSRTITYGSNWKFESGSPGVLTTTASAWDKLVFQCEDANTIHAVLVKDLK